MEEVGKKTDENNSICVSGVKGCEFLLLSMFHIFCNKNVTLNKISVTEITDFHSQKSTDYTIIAEEIQAQPGKDDVLTCFNERKDNLVMFPKFQKRIIS